MVADKPRAFAEPPGGVVLPEVFADPPEMVATKPRAFAEPALRVSFPPPGKTRAFADPPVTVAVPARMVPFRAIRAACKWTCPPGIPAASLSPGFADGETADVAGTSGLAEAVVPFARTVSSDSASSSLLLITVRSPRFGCCREITPLS
jgi:hypothetical protein